MKKHATITQVKDGFVLEKTERFNLVSLEDAKALAKDFTENIQIKFHKKQLEQDEIKRLTSESLEI